MIEAGIYSLISSNAGMLALLPDTSLNADVGAMAFGPAPIQRGNMVYPYLTYQVVTAAPSDYTLGGPEIEYKRFQFDVYAKEGTDANKIVLKALHRLLDKFTGMLSDGTRVLFASRVNHMDNFEGDGDTYRSVSEYEFQFVEPN